MQHIHAPYTEEERTLFDSRLLLIVICAVFVMLFGIALAIAIPILNLFIGMGGGFFLLWSASFFIITLCIPVFVWAGMQKSKYNIKKYNLRAKSKSA